MSDESQGRAEFGGLAGEVRRLRAENDDLRKRPPARTGLLGQALAHIVQKEIELKVLREENAGLRKRLDETLRIGLDAVITSEPEPTPGFFNAENMDYLNTMMHTNRLHIGKLSERIEKLEAMVNMPSDHDGLDVTHRRIDKLADRVAMLERVRWESEGEI